MSFLLKLLFLGGFIFIILLLSALLAADGKTRQVLIRAVKMSFAAVFVILLFNIYVYYFFKDTFFADPWYLAIFVPLIILWAGAPFMYKYIRPAITFNLARAAKMTNAGRFVKMIYFTLAVTALGFAAVALARPRDISKTELPPAEGVDIMLAVDVSESMLSDDFSPDRITAAKEAAKNFIKNRMSDRIGIVAFGADAALQSPLTLDYDSLLDFMDSVHVGMLPRERTAVGDAVAVASAHLEPSKSKSKIIVLLTDGESNYGLISPADAAKSAKALGIKIYAVGAAGPEDRGFGDGTLRELAAVTGGRYYRAYDNEGLNEIYSDIDRLEKTQYKNLTMVDYKDRYRSFLIIALALLCAAFIFDKFIFMRLP